VAVFQGIPLTIIGYDLGHPVQRTTLSVSTVEQLEAWTGKLGPGIPVDSREEALAVIAQIRSDLEAAREAQRKEPTNGGNGGGG
jgi:hypothetical protein